MRNIILLLCLFLAFPVQAQTDPRITAMTLEEKASMVTGKNFWETRDIPRLDVPAAWMADGPVGLRRSTGRGVGESLPATCFPSSAGMAATWNPALVERLGAGIGAEARFHDVTLLLAPGLNVKRHPLGGRNFEYYSEDPFLAGKTAAAFVRGVQSEGVGATLKHFAVNNQEYRRMLIDARVGERALHEIYLRGFEIAVREAHPQAVMSAYNKVNGTYASQHPYLLTDMLREAWGFAGLVVSDWGAVDDPAASVAAGLDLEMPGNPLTPAKIVEAVRKGKLDEAALDRAVAKVLELVDRRAMQAEKAKPEEAPEHHGLAREVALESIVLLGNDGVLPIEGDPARVGVVGRLAFHPRIQGIGSSQINATQIDVPADFLSQFGEAGGHTVGTWPTDYDEKGLSDEERASLAVFLAGQDVVVVFAGQPASHDAEAWDRPSMSLSAADAEVIDVVRESVKPFAVVLVGGGPMDVSAFAGDAGALLMGWLGGQGFGQAIARVIFGEASPSGKLSETWAWAADDHPSALNFPGGPAAVDYGEGLWVGYRYFQSFDRDVAYPFGHGLTYTEFDYVSADAPLTLESLDEGFDVTVEVENTGDRAAAETVEVYLRHLEPALTRPDRELVGFQKLMVEPGKSRLFTIHVDADRLAYYHDGFERWVVEPGDYEILVGASAADIRVSLPMTVTAGTMPSKPFTLESTVGEVYASEKGRAILDFIWKATGQKLLSEAEEDDFEVAVQKNLPFKKLSSFSEGHSTVEQLQGLLFLINSDMSADMVIGMLHQQMSNAQKPQENS